MDEEKAATKNAFVDIGYEPGFVFTNFLLQSSEFSLATLRGVSRSPSNTSKRAFAHQIASALRDGDLNPRELLRAYARQPRQWLSFRLGSPIRFPELQPAETLLKELGSEGWYGPITDENGKPRWFIRAFH